MKILIIEDEYNLADAISSVLKEEKYFVEINTDGEEGLNNALSRIYDLIILDVMLPHINGFEILRKIREEKLEVKVIMLTAKNSIDDKMQGFSYGADKDLGSILENMIFLELKRRNYDIYIGKYEDSEVDFVVKKNDGLKYIQVSLSVRDEKTLERELTPLKEIHDNYPKYMITLDYDSADYEGIRQINAIDLLMGRVNL